MGNPSRYLQGFCVLVWTTLTSGLHNAVPEDFSAPETSFGRGVIYFGISWQTPLLCHRRRVSLTGYFNQHSHRGRAPQILGSKVHLVPAVLFGDRPNAAVVWPWPALTQMLKWGHWRREKKKLGSPVHGSRLEYMNSYLEHSSVTILKTLAKRHIPRATYPPQNERHDNTYCCTVHRDTAVTV